jgi:hypothetical protein
MGRLGLSIDPRALRPAADAVCIEFQELVSDRQVWGSEIEKVDLLDGSCLDSRSAELTAWNLSSNLMMPVR